MGGEGGKKTKKKNFFGVFFFFGQVAPPKIFLAPGSPP